MYPILRIVLEKATSLSEARAFLADVGILSDKPAKSATIVTREAHRVASGASRKGTPWSPRDVSKLRRLYAANTPRLVIATALNRTITSVYQKASVLRLANRRAA